MLVQLYIQRDQVTRFKFYCEKLGIKVQDTSQEVHSGLQYGIYRQFKVKIEEEDLNLVRLTTSRFTIASVDKGYWIY